MKIETTSYDREQAKELLEMVRRDGAKEEQVAAFMARIRITATVIAANRAVNWVYQSAGLSSPETLREDIERPFE